MLRRTSLALALASIALLGAGTATAQRAVSPQAAGGTSTARTQPSVAHVVPGSRSQGRALTAAEAHAARLRAAKTRAAKTRAAKTRGTKTRAARTRPVPSRPAPRPAAPHPAATHTAPASVAGPGSGSAYTPPAATGVGAARVTRQGTQLLLDGQPWQFTGFNAFGATTWWGTNWGCGTPVYDLDRMFAQLRPGSVVRTWAFQALAWNNKESPQHLDFGPIDRVVQAAERSHQMLTLALSDQSGTCDDGKWHDPDWYRGGYKQRWNDDGRGLGGLSYADYVKAIVTRYRDSPAIAFWEPVNEPEASTCNGATGPACFDSSKRWCPPDSATTLKNFLTDIGAQIRAVDPHHLIAAGVGGGGQCGVESGRYTEIGASPGVDVMTYHDYGTNNDPYPGGLADRRRQAFTEIGKPLVVEEVGVTGGGCRSNADRAALYRAKVAAAFAHGISGYIPWWYAEGPSGCGDDFGPGDPLLDVLRDAAT